MQGMETKSIEDVLAFITGTSATAWACVGESYIRQCTAATKYYVHSTINREGGMCSLSDRMWCEVYDDQFYRRVTVVRGGKAETVTEHFYEPKAESKSRTDTGESDV